MSNGGCQCGAIRFRLKGKPVETYVCHCRDCQRQSSSAFGISVIVHSRDLELLQGSPKVWSRPADSGDVLDCHFCPDCGCRLWHIGRGDPNRVSVKGGTLDERPDLTAVPHIWTSRKLEGVQIPKGVPTFDKEPPKRAG